jgi:hypothetical protein
MAISINQQVDILYKKLIYGVTTTNCAANKSPSNESLGSPLLMRGDLVWAQAANIPSVAPASSSSVVTVYNDSFSNTIQATEDPTSTLNRAWITGVKNWIPPQFGSSYAVKVYAATTGASAPQTSGTMLPTDGSGNSDSYEFDYQAGVLYFADTNIPSALTSGKSIFVAGYSYSGTLGISTTTANLSVSNQLTASSTASSTGTSSGALVVSGGMGVGGCINVGGTLTSYYAVINGVQDSTSTTTGALVVGGGIGVGLNMHVGKGVTANSFNALSTQSSTSSSTGALVIAGGVGIGGCVNIAGVIGVGAIDITGTANSTSTTTGALVVPGGVGIGGNLNAGGNAVINGSLQVNSTASSTGTSTGAVIVQGGVSVSGQLYVDHTIQIHNAIVNSVSTIINTTASTIVDSFSTSLFRSAKYLMQVGEQTGSGANFEAIELLLLVDNQGTVYATEFGQVTTNGEMGDFAAETTGTTVNLYFTVYNTVNLPVTFTLYRTALTA